MGELRAAASVFDTVSKHSPQPVTLVYDNSVHLGKCSVVCEQSGAEDIFASFL